MSSDLRSWLLAFRFKTLTAAFVPVAVATALCIFIYGSVQWWVSLCALSSAFCIQIATNLFNDAIDFKKGADSEKRIGPQRVTQSGLLSEKSVWLMALFFVLVAAAFGWPLVMRGGVPIITLGLVSLFMAYSYTGGPFPLAYLGLGDLFVVLFFGLFAVMGTFYLQSLAMVDLSWVAGLQVGFLSTTLIAINNLRDSDTDKKVSKKTLAVRFGDRFVKLEIAMLFVLTYALLAYYVFFYGRYEILLCLVNAPLAFYISRFVFQVQDKPKLNKALGLAALHQMTFCMLLCLGLVL